MARITLPRTRYAERADIAAFLDRTLERLRTMPGIAAAGAIDVAPLADDRQGTTLIIDGATHPDLESVSTNLAFVTPGYFGHSGSRSCGGVTSTPATPPTAPR